MTTFLWMLYLAFTLFSTKSAITNIIVAIIYKKSQDNYDLFIETMTVLLWSIWYFYYLN